MGSRPARGQTMSDKYIIIDKIKWWIHIDIAGYRNVQPLCPTHHLRIYPKTDSYMYRHIKETHNLKCSECVALHVIPRSWVDEQKYVLDKIDSKILKTMRFINLDDEAIPIAEDKKSPKDGKYFVTALLTESKAGKRLIVYAGERGGKRKTQIFVEPDIKRLAFDQKDLHPNDVFTKLEATFADNSSAKMKKNRK